MTLADLIAAVGKLYIGTRAVKSAIGELTEGVSTSRALPAQKPSKGMKLTKHRVSSLEDRVKHIARLERKGSESTKIRAIAAKVLSRKCGKEWCLPEKNSRAEMTALFNYVRQNVRYTKDITDLDTFQHPERTLELGISDCDDYSSLLAALLMSVGYRVKFRVIRTTESKDWNHIYVLASDGKGPWMALDASVNKPAGWEAPRHIIAAHKDFDA